ncbi:MAG TPA: hypothetical protein VGQ97_00855, partial [Xanthobacteraceae bacterium]|nr:hypothetical protein [Xanthobacteraceae bacterium]
RSHQADGTTIETDYTAGETRHESYGLGEFKMHDLENTGDSELVFTTVEFLASANAPLPVPATVRAR